MNDFSAGACIRFGWNTFSKRPWFFAGTTLLVLFVEWFLSALGRGVQGSLPLAALLFVVTMVVSIFIDMGFVALFLNAYEDASSAHFLDLWHPHPFWKYTGASILSGVFVMLVLFACAIVAAVLAGFAHAVSGATFPTLFFVAFAIFAIVSLLFVSIVFMFIKYLVIARGLWPLQSIKESVRMTRGYRGQLLWLLVLIVLVNILGAVCILVGLLATIPMTGIALICAYRTLEEKKGAVSVA